VLPVSPLLLRVEIASEQYHTAQFMPLRGLKKPAQFSMLPARHPHISGYSAPE